MKVYFKRLNSIARGVTATKDRMKKQIYFWLLIFFVLFNSALSWALPVGNPCNSDGNTIYTGVGDCTIDSGGHTRDYHLIVPANFIPNSSPLVMYLQGSQAFPYELPFIDGTLQAHATQRGVALVAPWASFNYPWFPGLPPDRSVLPPDMTEVQFHQDLINALKMNIKVDPNQIYVTGISAGAVMSHILAMMIPDVAAIAPVADPFNIGYPPGQPFPDASGPVSVLMMRGEVDAYCGAIGGRGGIVVGEDVLFDYWTHSLGCTNIVPASSLCNGGTPDPSINSKNATSCPQGGEVQMYKFVGGQHCSGAGDNWDIDVRTPNTDPCIPYNPDVRVQTGVTIADLVFNFLLSHPKAGL